ncbi:MAG: hypothetical protein LBT24_01495 [Tannerella sp.]|nr:hypothetical protein [Tannerella sp.]
MKNRTGLGVIDAAVVLYGIVTFVISVFINHSENHTKHIELLFFMALYFILRVILGGKRENGRTEKRKNRSSVHTFLRSYFPPFTPSHLLNIYRIIVKNI